MQTTRPVIDFLGLFDTVGSVIESGRLGPRLRSHAFTSTNFSVATVRHAVRLAATDGNIGGEQRVKVAYTAIWHRLTLHNLN